MGDDRGQQAQSGTKLNVSWSYSNCRGGKGLFIANLVASDAYVWDIANVVGSAGHGSTAEFVASDPGPYHLQIDGECSWTVTVFGQP